MIASGKPAQIETEIQKVILEAPPSLLLGADYTVEADTNWERLKQVISVVHQVGRA